MLLGCIADDLTGATDLANNLARGGLRVAQRFGVPSPQAAHADDVPADAVVVALKSRTAPVAEAVAQSLAACAWLRARGARQIYFKVCSTFDSTAQGNIGPVTEALMQALDAECVPVTPAFPATGRSVYRGHLFVGDALLSDSPMRDHPLTPMRDADLVRVLQAQCSRERVGRVTVDTVWQGAAAIADRLQALSAAGQRIAIVDALCDADLHALAQAARDLPLVVAASGLAIGWPAAHGLSARADAADDFPAAAGAAAVVAGSCSAATRAQVADFIRRRGAAFALDLDAGADQPPDPVALADAALAWANERLGTTPLLVYSTAEPARVRALQQRLGTEAAGALIEQALARVAQGLIARGVRQLVVAGGETAGAVAQALALQSMTIGPQIDPGVPWCHVPALGLHLCLKSGNFGATDFFTRAFMSLRAVR